MNFLTQALSIHLSTILGFRITHTSKHPPFAIQHHSQYTRHFQNNKKNSSIKRLSRCALAAAAGAGTTTRRINVSEPVNAENLGLWTYSWAQPQEEWSQAALARADVFYGSSLEGKKAASGKTYRDHDDGWFQFSWVVLKSLRLTKSLQVLYTPRALFTRVM